MLLGESVGNISLNSSDGGTGGASLFKSTHFGPPFALESTKKMPFRDQKNPNFLHCTRFSDLRHPISRAFTTSVKWNIIRTSYLNAYLCSVITNDVEYMSDRY